MVFRQPKKGFTLIELLVVISIIALLLSILLPALGKAKMAAQKVVCQSNLKQQGLACTLYMNDYKDIFPSMAELNGPGTGPLLSYGAWGGKASTQEWFPQRLLNSYIGRAKDVSSKDTQSSLKVFRCPSDKGAAPGGAGQKQGLTYQPTCWDYFGDSYYYNSAALNNGAGNLGLWNKKRNDVKNFGRVILVGDFTLATYFYGYAPWQNMYWHDQKVLGWANTAFVDLHVSYVQMTLSSPDYHHGNGWTFFYNGTR